MLSLMCNTTENKYRVFIKYCVFSENFKIFRSLVFLSSPSVYTHKAARKPALQRNWQSSEKSQNLKEKTQYLMNTLYINREMMDMIVGLIDREKVR